ncbi:MAG: hypothetical protein IH986_11200 [Planctomycetes bacterium]|nr:hypothetical protein [Planctomycetota bacterium]
MIKPSPIALVVCDNVYREEGGKIALVGLFNRIMAPTFPAKHPRLCVYAAVTDIHPGTRFRLVIVNPETDHKVAELEGPVPENVSPTSICDLEFSLSGLTFPTPARYDIQFWGNEHLLMQRPFEVAHLDPEGGT